MLPVTIELYYSEYLIGMTGKDGIIKYRGNNKQKEIRCCKYLKAKNPLGSGEAI
jgi:hypothetical protein